VIRQYPNDRSLDNSAIERWCDEGGSTLLPRNLSGQPSEMNADDAGRFHTVTAFLLRFFDMDRPRNPGPATPNT